MAFGWGTSGRDPCHKLKIELATLGLFAMPGTGVVYFAPAGVSAPAYVPIFAGGVGEFRRIFPYSASAVDSYVFRIFSLLNWFRRNRGSRVSP